MGGSGSARWGQGPARPARAPPWLSGLRGDAPRPLPGARGRRTRPLLGAGMRAGGGAHWATVAPGTGGRCVRLGVTKTQLDVRPAVAGTRSRGAGAGREERGGWTQEREGGPPAGRGTAGLVRRGHAPAERGLVPIPHYVGRAPLIPSTLSSSSASTRPPKHPLPPPPRALPRAPSSSTRPLPLPGA